nr:hypothetical protein [uncultured bacterium]
MHENQRRILDYLLGKPEGATLDELAAHLGITKTAAKEHVVKVEAQGLLSYRDAKGAVGRPRRHYLLTSAGQEAFPRQYSWLSNVLLELLAKDLGPSGVSRLMTKLAADVSGSFRERFARAGTMAELLAEVTAVLNELGYRATLKQSDLRKGAVVEATNCVYHSVAKKHPELCRFDTRFLESSTGMNVRLECCIAKGGAVCRFAIRKRDG